MKIDSTEFAVLADLQREGAFDGLTPEETLARAFAAGVELGKAVGRGDLDEIDGEER